MKKIRLNIPPEGRILNINKPVDWTSFDVVNKIRYMTGIKKVGHAGTLDPFATGVLLVCLGKATKKSSQLMEDTKEYIAKITLGKETDTMDLTGKTISESEIPNITKTMINKAFEPFSGTIQQEIPAFSAAKFKGKRLYKLAREGKETPQLFKTVTIHKIILESFTTKDLTIRVECGCGTYIRTLGRDIARALNTMGYVETLVRTKVGEYHIEDSITIEVVQSEIDQEAAQSV